MSTNMRETDIDQHARTSAVRVECEKGNEPLQAYLDDLYYFKTSPMSILFNRSDNWDDDAFLARENDDLTIVKVEEKPRPIWTS